MRSKEEGQASEKKEADKPDDIASSSTDDMFAFS
jgi:hypothetical protein